METKFKDELRQYIIDNFQYDPAFERKVKSSSNKLREKRSFESLNFPEKKEIFNSFIFHALKILNDNASFRERKKEQILSILAYIYLFFEDDFNFEENPSELQFPFKFSKELSNCFETKKDHEAFQIFNFLLLLSKEIDDNYFQSMNFILLNIFYLYEYVFIESNSEEKFQIIIAKIISTLFENMVQFQEQNKFVLNLNSFFFYEGKVSFTHFLKPLEDSKKIAKNIFSQLNNLMGEIIQKELQIYDKMPDYLIENLDSIERIPLIEQANKQDEDNSDEEEINENINNIIFTNEIKDEIKIKEANKIEDLTNQVGKLSDENKELAQKMDKLKTKVETLNNNKCDLEYMIETLKEDNIKQVNNLKGQIKEIDDDKNKLKQQVEDLSSDKNKLKQQVEDLSSDKNKLKQQVEDLSSFKNKLKQQVEDLSSDKNKLKQRVEDLSSDKNKLKQQVEDLSADKNNYGQQINSLNEKMEYFMNEIENLKKIIGNKDLTISLNEQKIKSQKEEIITSNKEKREFSNKALNLEVENAVLEEKIKKKNTAYNKLNQDQTILKEENQNLKENTEILKYASIEKVLIGSRDFLKLIINDLCFYFDVTYSTEYVEVIKKLIDAINMKEEIKEFIQNVDLIDFLDSLGKVFEDMDHTSHALFPELSSKYRNSAYNKSEEEVKTNIIKCMQTFGIYVKKDFISLTKFFNDYYEYPKYTKQNINSIKGEKKYLFDAIKRYETDCIL